MTLEQAPVVGKDCKLYLNGGTHATPTWTEVKNAINVSANLGKGAALKSAFRHIFGLDDDSTRCIITLDADGQHSVEDVLAMARRCECGNMVIGVRSFTGDVPFRSRFGNVLTRWVLRWTSKLNLDDTQSGLRCLPLEFDGIFALFRQESTQGHCKCGVDKYGAWIHKA